MHTSMGIPYMLWFPSLRLCFRCAIFHGMVVDMQWRYETYIGLAFSYNNIAVFTWMSVTLDFCTAVYNIATTTVLWMAWRPCCRRKNFCCDSYFYHCICNLWCWYWGCSVSQGCYWRRWRSEDWASIFLKRGEAPALIPAISCIWSLVRHYVVVACFLPRQLQAINETHSLKCATARALSTNLQKQGKT